MTKRHHARLLVVDDHLEMAQMLVEQFRELGFSADTAVSGADALTQLERRMPDAVVTDLRMDEVDGLDLLEAIRRIDAQVPVIVMTAFGAVDSAIDAIRRGAYHYLAKPFPFEELLVYVERALEERQLREEHKALQRLVRDRGAREDLIGESPPMRALSKLVDRVASSDAPVLILGESGTGKELVARTLHDQSLRRDRRFVPVNCAALPEALLESELFGHVRGAFTGASGPRRGLFVEADGGTLFLDEIGEMPPPLQAKLLRVIEDGEVRPVGADATRRVDVRLLAATHRDLEARVVAGRFREDLYYRLNVVPVRIPPLRERTGDIPRLAMTLLERARNRTPGASLRAISAEALALLERHPWPGNVRQLENLMLRLVLLVPDECASAEAVMHLGALDLMAEDTPDTSRAITAEVGAPSERGTEPTISTKSADVEAVLARAFEEHLPWRQSPESLPPMDTVEWTYLSWLLDHCGGNKARAARILGIDVSTIHRRLGREH